MESALDWHSAKALLEWQIELGADEAIGDTPLDRFALAKEEAEKPAPPKASTKTPVPPTVHVVPEVDAVQVARDAAAGAGSLDALRDAIAGFDHCALKRGARNLVFGEGHASARVLVLGEAPNRDEDREGRPFVGPTGTLLDRMLGAIDLDRTAQTPDRAVYVTNVLPWRPPQNHHADAEAHDIALMVPFVARHIELLDPEFIILMCNMACRAGWKKQGVSRLRGTWGDAFGRPALAMTHPAYLLKNPIAKRDAWQDLLSLKARLQGESIS